MSQFGTKLRALISRKQLTLQEVATISGLSTATISELCTGKQPTTSRENVEKIMRCFHDDHELIPLAIAHLVDETPAAVRRLLTIQPSTEPLRETYPDDLTNLLDDDFETAVRRIRRAIPQNEDLRLCVIDLAGATCKGNEEEPKLDVPGTKTQKTDRN